MRISDWSSDVCSSDLLLTRDEPIKIICIAPDNVARDEPTLVKRSLAALRISVIALIDGWCTDQQLPLLAVRQIGERFVNNTQLSTDERRGGKECVRTGSTRCSRSQ